MTLDELLAPILNTTVPLRLTDSPETIGEWDSLAQLNIFTAVEDIIGEELSTDEVMRMNTVSGIVEVCRTRGLELIP